jgi:uncharacterized protein YbjT (DUF2867 family)
VVDETCGRAVTAAVLVTGGTGTLGRLVVARLRDAGCDVRVLSRRRAAADGMAFVTGDLATGEGIEAAVDGAGTIVHCAGSSKGRRGEDPEPGTGGITGGGDTSGVHLCRRR